MIERWAIFKTFSFQKTGSQPKPIATFATKAETSSCMMQFEDLETLYAVKQVKANQGEWLSIPATTIQGSKLKEML